MSELKLNSSHERYHQQQLDQWGPKHRSRTEITVYRHNSYGGLQKLRHDDRRGKELPSYHNQSPLVLQ